MSPRRLRWTGLACLALSAFTALTDTVAQAHLVLFGPLLHRRPDPVGAAGVVGSDDTGGAWRAATGAVRRESLLDGLLGVFLQVNPVRYERRIG